MLHFSVMYYVELGNRPSQDGFVKGQAKLPQ
jgi:hypothetical protein